METREQILAVGREMLLGDGLRGITTSAIAQRARVSKKTLYQHFPSKDQLMEAIVVSFMEENLSRWDEILESKDSAIDRILASLRFAGEFLPHIQTQLINQVEVVAPQLWEKIDAIRMKRLLKLKILMKEAQQEGFLRDDVNPDHWILLFTGAIRSVVTPQVLLRTGIPLIELLGSIQIIYYDGLLTDKGKRHTANKETS
ncbi:TetR/AcrR family transcriptional regulator [Candidatus Bipolaricaulota bacterium]|nr:TetR/AcrR family transcriptional regulator [Candidatus Bipolaricaulota bacterium]